MNTTDFVCRRCDARAPYEPTRQPPSDPPCENDPAGNHEWRLETLNFK